MSSEFIVSAIAEFKRMHDGRAPRFVAVSPEAVIVLASGKLNAIETVPSEVGGVEIMVGLIKHVLTPGDLASNVVGVRYQDLPGGRKGLVAYEGNVLGDVL
jgi:hypothetical protein